MRTLARPIRTAVVLAGSQRGVAVPMALLSLVILSALVVAFLVLSAIEPTIANNQLAVAQARALAEAGVERALWALSNPTDSRGIPIVFTTAPPPYDGGELVAVAAGGHARGGFRVTVTNGPVAYERRITAVGFVPTDATPGRRALQTITVTAVNPQLIVKNPPAAVSIRGALEARGNLQVDARADQSCGQKVGTLTHGDTALPSAAADIRGATGDGLTRNRVTDAAGGVIPPGAGDVVKNASGIVFDGFSLSDADLSALKAFAKTRGTYLRGAVTFGAGNRMPDGLVFVDTLSGERAAAEHIPASDLASVVIDAGASADPSGVWSGWLIVNGSLAVRGDVRLKGFIYAQNTLQATGPAGLSGALVGRNIRDLAGSSIDSEPAGQVSIVYNCRDALTGGGKIPGRWSVKSGSYREVSGS